MRSPPPKGRAWTCSSRKGRVSVKRRQFGGTGYFPSAWSKSGREILPVKRQGPFPSDTNGKRRVLSSHPPFAISSSLLPISIRQSLGPSQTVAVMGSAQLGQRKQRRNRSDRCVPPNAYGEQPKVEYPILPPHTAITPLPDLKSDSRVQSTKDACATYPRICNAEPVDVPHCVAMRCPGGASPSSRDRSLLHSVLKPRAPVTHFERPDSALPGSCWLPPAGPRHRRYVKLAGCYRPCPPAQPRGLNTLLPGRSKRAQIQNLDAQSVRDTHSNLRHASPAHCPRSSDRSHASTIFGFRIADRLRKISKRQKQDARELEGLVATAWREVAAWTDPPVDKPRENGSVITVEKRLQPVSSADRRSRLGIPSPNV